jgi:hypothetical protein
MEAYKNEQLDVPQPKYKPLTTEQKLAVREAQFQLQTAKEQATAFVKQANDNLVKTISDIGLANGISTDTKVEFQLPTLEFVDQK